MTDTDLDLFSVEVRRLATIFRFRASPLELTQITTAYFKALRGRPMSAVTSGADTWIGKGQRFPKPFEWLESMPRPGAQPINVPPMSQGEADEWSRAERLRWEDQPCPCVVCFTAGVSHRPLRFVPEFDEFDRDRKVFEPVRGRTVTAGHWAHGDELARWYVAKEMFWAQFRSFAGMRIMAANIPRASFEERIERIFKPRTLKNAPPVEREPGEEG